jgi:hypothetical protein
LPRNNAFGSGGLSGGGLAGFGTMGTSPRFPDPQTDKQLQDAQKRIKELEDRLKQYEKKLKDDKDPVEWNAPPENLQGVIREVSKDGLVRITLGSDKGLKTGHTLEVYRLKPTPTYLGRIQIAAVSATESVAKVLVQQTAKPMQLGDHVTDSLIQK